MPCAPTEVTYLKAPIEWDHELGNPFSADGSYGPEWSCFRIVDEGAEWMPNRRSARGLYYVLANRERPNLERHVADFLRYESSYGRDVIISCPENMDADAFVREAMRNTPDGAEGREDDPKWVVHSTTQEAWQSISQCGELRSIARLRRDGVEVDGIGLFTFGEPDDYAEYVMFAPGDAIGPEHVVASRRRGYVFTEENAPYEPGVRLYFDGWKIIRDGLVVRDGIHQFKVHHCLPLAPYLKAAITTADLDPEGRVSTWTPRSFQTCAYEYFMEKFAADG